MNNRKLLTKMILLACTTMLFSCGGATEKGDDNIASNYHLEIVDSVTVDVLATYPRVLDVHPKTGEILLAQTNPLMVWILSKEGEVLKEWTKTGDGPDEIGSTLLSAEFFEDKIALMGRMTVKLFDKDFNLVNIYKANFSSSGRTFLGFNHMIEFVTNKQHKLVTYFGGPQTDLSPVQKEYYEAFNIVDVLSPNDIKGKAIENLNQEGSNTTIDLPQYYKPIGKLEANSRYLNDKAHYSLKPEFDVKNGTLYYAMKDDTTMNILDLTSGELLSQYSIPFDDFILFEGYSLGTKGYKEQNEPRDWEGQIYKVINVEDKEVVFYTSGTKLSTLEQYKDDPDFREQTLRINYMKHVIARNGKRLNTDLKMDSKYQTPTMSDEQGFIWAAQNVRELEEEPDMVTLYKLKIVEDEEK